MNSVSKPPTDSSLATITPRPDAETCGCTGCTETESLASVDPHASKYDQKTVCPEHLLGYLERVAQ